MNYRFLATAVDKSQVFKFIFENTGLQVFDLYSEYSKEACQYKSVAEIEAKFDLESGVQFATTFQLWSPRFGVEVVFEKINLKPEYCEGHTFRYAMSGWGLIQLYLGGHQEKVLHHSHIGHFNEKAALSRAADNKELSEVKHWKWKEIVSTSGRLRRQIHKIAVGEFNGMDVLSGANTLSKSGVELRY